MWFVQVFCLFASWANPNCLLIIPKTQKQTQTKCTTFAQICWFLDTHPVLPKNYTQNPKTDPNVWYCVKCLLYISWTNTILNIFENCPVVKNLLSCPRAKITNKKDRPLSPPYHPLSWILTGDKTRVHKIRKVFTKFG